MLKIDKKITGFKVLNKEEKASAEALAESQALEKARPLVKEKLHRGDEPLPGKTYKIKPPTLNHGIYITVNDLLLEGKFAPYEVFLSTKNAEEKHFLDVLSLTLTTFFRLQQDISHLLLEYSDIPAVNGGYWVKPKVEGEKGVFYKSYIGQIADVIARHLKTLEQENVSSISKPSEIEIKLAFETGIYTPSVSETLEDILKAEKLLMVEIQKEEEEEEEAKPKGQLCPSCGESSMQLLDGCLTCLTCGFSKCG